MTERLDTPGRPWIRVSDARDPRGRAGGFAIYKEGEMPGKKAPSDGIYVDGNGNQFRIRAGDVIPEGMTFEAGELDAAPERTEERAEEAAPQNRMEPGAPENRAAVAKPKKDAE